MVDHEDRGSDVAAQVVRGFHEEAHRYNARLGDILTEPNTMERFLAASAAGQDALVELGAHLATTES